MEKRFYMICLFIAVVVFITTAIFSAGFHHWDEHYQIVEFASFKLGNCQASELAWEYKAQIRPALQPLLLFLTAKLLSFTSPFFQIGLLRLLTGLLMLFGIHQFILCTYQQIQNRTIQKVYFILSFFLYFIPYISVRFSSETTGAVCFLYGVVLLLRDCYQKNHFWVGLLFGFSFVLRCQMLAAIGAVILFTLVFRKLNLKQVLLLVGGGILSFSIGVVVDYWFYGQWVLSTWLYFKANVINGVASNYGVSPWWWYVQDLITTHYLNLILVPLLLLLIAFLIRKYNNLIAWIVFFFLLVHFSIAHKEMRFLFPIVFFIPYAISLIIDEMYTWIIQFKSKIIFFIAGIYIILIGTINFTILSVKAITPADGQVVPYQYLHQYNGKPFVLYFLKEKNSFQECHLWLRMSFYQPKPFEMYELSAEKFNTIDKNPLIFYIANSYTNMDSLGIEPVYRTLPQWFTQLNKDNCLKTNNAHWTIYQKK